MHARSTCCYKGARGFTADRTSAFNARRTIVDPTPPTVPRSALQRDPAIDPVARIPFLFSLRENSRPIRRDTHGVGLLFRPLSQGAARCALRLLGLCRFFFFFFSLRKRNHVPERNSYATIEGSPIIAPSLSISRAIVHVCIFRGKVSLLSSRLVETLGLFVVFIVSLFRLERSCLSLYPRYVKVVPRWKNCNERTSTVATRVIVTRSFRLATWKERGRDTRVGVP